MKYKLFLIAGIIIFLFLILKEAGNVVGASNPTPTPGRDKCYTANKIIDPTTNTTEPKCVCYDGLVPCGKEVDIYTVACLSSGGPPSRDKFGTTAIVYCTLCHFFIMLNEIVNFVVLKLVPPVAVIMIVYAGILFYFGGNDAGKVKSAQNIIKYVAIGLFLIYGSFMLTGTILGVLGIQSWANPFTSGGNAININCVPEFR